MVTTTKGSAVLALPSDTEILVTRDFNAPRHLVWKVLTEPDLIKRWWAGQRGTVTDVTVDLRVGGTWRYVMTADGGFEVGFHGEYRELDAPAGMVQTEVFEGMPDGDSEPSLNDYTLAERDGRTTLTVRTVVSSKEVRDGIIATGMEGGMQEAYDLLEELAAELAEAK
ncbi:SRPBCC family protein [Promicromonospora panici]|uniref:SRPBCC family protein n=1 Tax=Promicromonospora panici TaxID=2219658 RepID=UPI00101CD85E|nr:SRPBCC family protein [Promicromonospora panici]